MSNKEKEKYYLYPEYVTEVFRPLLGLSVPVIVIILFIFIGSIFTSNIVIVIIASILSLTIATLASKPNGIRTSKWDEIKYMFQSVFMKKFYSMRPREIKPIKRKQIRFTQDFLNFSDIDDSVIYMQDNSRYIFLRIMSNDLNISSKEEIRVLITNLQKAINNIKYPFQFFCQDGSINLNHNIKYMEKLKVHAQGKFIKDLIQEDIDVLSQQTSNTTTQKSYYIRLDIPKDVEVNSAVNQLRNQFKSNNLEVYPVLKSEIKEMLSIFYLGLHGHEFPDSELDLDYPKEEREKILKKKNVNYFEYQKFGIWTFKEYLAPITSQFYTDKIRWGNRLMKTFAVKSFVSSTTQSPVLEKITSLKGVTTTIYIEPIKQKEFFDKMNLDTNVKRATAIKETDIIDREINEEERRETYNRIKREHQKMVYVTVYYLLTAESEEELKELEEQLYLESSLNNMVLENISLNYLSQKAMMSTSPIGKNHLGGYLKQNMPTESLSNLYPFNSRGFIDEQGMFLGFETTENIKGNELSDIFLVDFFKKDSDKRSNHNIMINGTSGVGKTVLLMVIIMNMVKQGHHVDFLDVEGTYQLFIEWLGGINIEVNGNNEFAINPLHIRVTTNKTTGVMKDYISQVRRFMAIYKQDWNSDKLDAFEIYLRKAYEKRGINEKTDVSLLATDEYPILQDVYDVILQDFNKYNDEDKENRNIVHLDLLRSLLLGLNSCVGEGADAKLFNRYTYMGEEVGKVINYNLKSLKSTAENRKLAQMVNVQTWIQTKVYKNTDPNVKFALGLDEAHALMKKEFSETIHFLDECERLYRKYGGGLLLASQTSDEFIKGRVDDQSLNVFFQMPTYKFFFHAGDMDYGKFKEFMRLTDNEINILAEDRKGKCIFKIGKERYDLSIAMPEWFKEVKMDA